MNVCLYNKNRKIILNVMETAEYHTDHAYILTDFFSQNIWLPVYSHATFSLRQRYKSHGFFQIRFLLHTEIFQKPTGAFKNL